MTEWKSLANSIIHDGFVPGTSITCIGCEKCGNPFLYMHISNSFPVFVSSESRVSIAVYECPECGHRELDCFGTYGLPDNMPGTIMPFVGHFFELWFGLLKIAQDIEIKKGPGEE
jgi:hypothetical protein